MDNGAFQLGPDHMMSQLRDLAATFSSGLPVATGVTLDKLLEEKSLQKLSGLSVGSASTPAAPPAAAPKGTKAKGTSAAPKGEDDDEEEDSEASADEDDWHSSPATMRPEKPQRDSIL